MENIHEKRKDGSLMSLTKPSVPEAPVDSVLYGRKDRAWDPAGEGSSDHSELTNLEYANSGHTGFQPSGDYIEDAPSDEKTYGRKDGDWVEMPEGSVDSVFGRTGDVEAAENDYTWGQIDKTVSDIADITTKSHTSLDDVGTNTHTDIDSHIDSDGIDVHSAATNIVFNSGDQTIGGIKTFSSVPECATTATTANQLVNKSLLDSVSQGLLPKATCRAATTGNITLADEQTIDTVSVVAGDRVLVKDQTDPTENGIYVVVDTDPWTRASDYDTDAEVVAGTYTYILDGAAQPTGNKNTQWVQYEISPEVGVDPIRFRQLPSPNEYTASSGVKLETLDFQIDLSDTNPSLEIEDGGLRVKVDDSSIERSASGVQVKALGVTSTMLAGNIPDSKLQGISTAGKVDGASLTNLANTPSAAGVIPIANLATGTPTGTKYVRDDGTLATPPGGGGSGTVETIVAGDNITVDPTDPANPIVSAVFTNSIPKAEIPTGVIDGVNTSFTLSETPVFAESVIVMLDGVVQYNGTDYEMLSDVIEFVTPPEDGSTIFVYYQSSGGDVGAKFAGLSKITVGITEPVAPSAGDLWVDTN